MSYQFTVPENILKQGGIGVLVAAVAWFIIDSGKLTTPEQVRSEVLQAKHEILEVLRDEFMPRKELETNMKVYREGVQQRLTAIETKQEAEFQRINVKLDALADRYYINGTPIPKGYRLTPDNRVINQ